MGDGQTGAGAGRGGRRQDLVHGQRRDRAQGRGGLRPPAAARDARARRQGRDDRVRRRRPRPRRRRRADRLVHEHRPVLLRHRAHLRGRRRSTSAFVEKVVGGRAALRQSDRGESDIGAIFWDRQLAIIERHVQRRRRQGRARARRRAPQPEAARASTTSRPCVDRRDPRDGPDAPRDLRAGGRDHARRRRGGGAAPGERLALRPQRQRLDARQGEGLPHRASAWRPAASASTTWRSPTACRRRPSAA